MNYKKIIAEIKLLEKWHILLNKNLRIQPIFRSKNKNYTQKDKEDFLALWDEYTELFLHLERLIKKTKYRKFYIFKNYSKLVLQRYLLRLYFYILQELLLVFWEHERFVRELIKENRKYSYSVFAWFVYKPKYINIYNILTVLLYPYKPLINKNVYEYIKVWKFINNPIKRIRTDSSNLYFHCKHTTDKWMFKVMRIVWNSIAHIRFSRRKKWLITQKNLKKYLDIAKPWDILLTRWNWNATNISIPGFWKHMSLYMGTWKYLMENFECKKLDKKLHYIIESTSDWVLLKPIADLVEHNDYLWVIRSKFSLNKRKRVIQKALDQKGKWYDYIFNFYSDNSLVCSELVLKSYAKDDENDEWFSIELENIWMWITFPPNNIFKILAKYQHKKNPEISPYFFIDSIEKTHKNFISSQKALLKSWKRPRFSFLLK